MIENRDLLTNLQAGVNALLDIAGEELERAAETDTQFSLSLYLDMEALDHALLALAPHTDLFDITLEYHVQDGSGTASLTPGGLVAQEWNREPDLSPPELEHDLIVLFESLAKQLSRTGDPIQTDSLAHNLQLLAQAGASVEMSLYVVLDKAVLIQNLQCPQNVRGLLYIVADKFLRGIRTSDLPALDALLAPSSEDTLIVMLGDAAGAARGPNVRICGRDRWATPGALDFQAGPADRNKLSDSTAFRDEECHWEIQVPGLSPHHLHVKNSTLNQEAIVNAFVQLRDRLSVAYLANRVRVHDGIVTCEFRGHKLVQVVLSPLDGQTTSLSIFKLFAWAYENSSSDKLGIARQVISLQLGDDAVANYAALAGEAGEILGIAKSNFQLFLRRSVELYFDKRLKVSEFLRKFSDEVSASVSALTSELVSNLYKTVGVILGVVIAALVDPDQTPLIASLTSFLYLIYITFILTYWLPSSLWRFRNKVRDYRYNVSELRDVLSEDEIERLEGKSFERTSWMFWFWFIVTGLIYTGLGVLAFFIAIGFLLRLPP